jgi:uncharacterized membrane protein
VSQPHSLSIKLALKITLVVIAISAYIVLMYLSSSAPDAAARTVVLTVLAWQGFAVALLWMNKKRLWAALLALPAILLFVYYDHLAKFEWLCVIPNLLVNGSLCYFFAQTLAPGKTALITNLAKRVHGSLPPPIERYTRHITIVWCAFFALTIVISLVLYFGVSFAAWSLFSNVYALPMLVAMFALEYLYRRLRFPWFEHVSIAAGVRAFTSFSSEKAMAQKSKTDAKVDSEIDTNQSK